MTDLPELVSAPSACLEQQHPIIRLNHNSKTRNHLLRFVYRLTVAMGAGTGGAGKAKHQTRSAIHQRHAQGSRWSSNRAGHSRFEALVRGPT